jgi:hypothetical protein
MLQRKSSVAQTENLVPTNPHELIIPYKYLHILLSGVLWRLFTHNVRYGCFEFLLLFMMF